MVGFLSKICIYGSYVGVEIVHQLFMYLHVYEFWRAVTLHVFICENIKRELAYYKLIIFARVAYCGILFVIKYKLTYSAFAGRYQSVL